MLEPSTKTYRPIQTPVSYLDKLQVEIRESPIIKVLNVSRSSIQGFQRYGV